MSSKAASCWSATARFYGVRAAAAPLAAGLIFAAACACFTLGNEAAEDPAKRWRVRMGRFFAVCVGFFAGAGDFYLYAARYESAADVSGITYVTALVEESRETDKGVWYVLKNVSFTIEPGESVGIVGKTGSGKTTIVDLLLRTYNVPDGTLFIDDHDVNTVSIHSVREGCAYVPQDNFLFSDTIAHNIGFGVDDAAQEDIDRAAALADVRDNIVDFKDGYETVLGERGVTVSGGQKQRISIARALLKDAPILILDDSVSAVDTRTEKIILDNLKSTRAGRTTLLIAHRISTVEGLDKIVFLDDGRVEAVGPHDELYATCAEYRRMVDLQRLEDETEAGETAAQPVTNAEGGAVHD